MLFFMLSKLKIVQTQNI